ncbi:MAG: HI1506-related protein [Gammaproteobacteria bacterium]
MDDLTRIKGIGPKTAEELRARGVTSFAQIAGFASTEVPVDVADLLPASRMDDWGPQAVLYAAESVPGAPPEVNSETPPQAVAVDGPPAAAEPKEADEQPASTNTPEGSSGTAREAPSTGGGTSDGAVASPNVGTQSGSPTHVRIAAKRDGFRRAGMRHSKAAVEHPIDRFTCQQIAALLAEPNLTVELLTYARGGTVGGAT